MRSELLQNNTVPYVINQRRMTVPKRKKKDAEDQESISLQSLDLSSEDGLLINGNPFLPSLDQLDNQEKRDSELFGTAVFNAGSGQPGSFGKSSNKPEDQPQKIDTMM